MIMVLIVSVIRSKFVQLLEHGGVAILARKCYDGIKLLPRMPHCTCDVICTSLDWQDSGARAAASESVSPPGAVGALHVRPRQRGSE